jgi:hypothetical protein
MYDALKIMTTTARETVVVESITSMPEVGLDDIVKGDIGLLGEVGATSDDVPLEMELPENRRKG